MCIEYIHCLSINMIANFWPLFLLSLFLKNFAKSQTHNETCTTGTGCDADTPLICLGGKCICWGDDVPYSVWDPYAQTCFLLAGTNCTINPSSLEEPRCIPTAHCYNQNGRPVCVCNQHLTENKDKKCHLVFGDRCRQENDLCDPLQFLKCSLENKCDCGEGGWYDETNKMCYLLPGTQCTTNTEDITCMDGIDCRPDNNRTLVCRCRNPSEPNLTLETPPFCVLSHSEDCANNNPTVQCDPSAHLICDAETATCQCDGEGLTSLYDDKTNTCLRLAEKGCSVDKEGYHMKCVPGAICNNIKGESKCRCRAPLSESNDRCYLPLGKNCSQQNDLCDRNKFLSCDHEGKCACGPGAVFVESFEVCQLLPGSECSLIFDLPSCIDGTKCGFGHDVPGTTCNCLNPVSEPSLDDLTKCFLSHGDVCATRYVDCDPYSHLECIGDICHCQGESTGKSIFDPKTKTCLLLAEEKCAPEPDGMSCIHSATCQKVGSEYKCQCRFPLSRGNDGFCYFQKGQNCTQSNDLCDPLKFLECDLEGKCSCSPGAVFVPSTEICQLLPGSECSLIFDLPSCIDGTECGFGHDVPGSTCNCLNPVSKPSLDDPTKCFLSHGNVCATKYVDCDPYSHLECIGDICHCQGETTGKSIFDSKTKTCLRLADESCEPEPSGMSCIHTATCQKVGSEYKCQCRFPMSRGSDGSCYLQHQQNCTQANDFCDRLKFLKCDLEGKCSCSQGSIFEPINKPRCVVLPGEECQPDTNTENCIEGTECRLNQISRKTICECIVPGSQPSLDDPTKCFLSHGKTCDSVPSSAASACDPYYHLECNGDICICQGEKNTSIYDGKTNKCLRLAEEECFPEPGGMGCISTASCKKIGSQYQCICRPPMSRGSDGLCYLQYNQNCTMQNDFCNKNNFLTCDNEGQCTCRNGTIYDEILDTCLLLPDQECHNPMGSQLCVPSTKCLPLEGSPTKYACQCPGIARKSKIEPTICVLHHNQPCPKSTSGTDLCDPFEYLECTESSHCSCKNEYKVWLDPETMTCYLKANHNCLPSEKYPLAQKCTPNSYCFNQEGLSTCVCKAGFESNRNGQCFLPHMSKCSLKNDLCDPASFLTCNLENRCTCGEEALFNDATKTCELLSNATCTPLHSYPPPQPCIPNAMCRNTTRKCECIHYFEENQDRQCFLNRKTHCDKSRDLCDPTRHLTCSLLQGEDYRQCLCQGEDEGLGWFSQFQKKCFRLAGSLCGRQDESDCIPNSYCDPIEKTCTCNETMKLVPNQEKFCFIPHSVSCSTRNDLCDRAAFLECHQNPDTHFSENICGCQRGYETFYDPKAATCRLISDRPCNPGGGIIHTPRELQLCDENARCLPNAAGNFTFRCRCNEKYIPNPEGICYLPHRSNCASDPIGCDPYGYLKCRKRFKDLEHSNKTINIDVRHCVCSTEQMYYDEEAKQCFSFPGEFCDIFPEAQKCRKNAHCAKNHICECDPGYEPTPDGQCLLKYREICQEGTADECHTHANLECRAGFCLCPEGYIEHYYYDGASHHNRTMCIPGYNQTCEHKLWLNFPKLKCSPEAFLKCSENVNGGICLCQHVEQVFLGPERQCRSTRGMPCDDYEMLCVPGAECIPGIGITPYLRCECAENYTVNRIDPKFCVSGGSSIFLELRNVVIIAFSFVTYFVTQYL